jgi:hypothetical protein
MDKCSSGRKVLGLGQESYIDRQQGSFQEQAISLLRTTGQMLVTLICGGTLDNNYYCRPLNETNTFQLIKTTGNQNTTLAGWQSAAQKEWSSKKSPKTITNINSLRFEYNLTTSNKTVSLGAAYIDVKGVSYPTSITLAPFTSAVLIPQSGGTPRWQRTQQKLLMKVI